MEAGARAEGCGAGRGAEMHPGCAIWGVLNVTPDSFSDGGLFLDLEAAIARGSAMLAEGAEVIDVGGESSRPKGSVYGEGAAEVPDDVELRRVVPVIERLVADHGASVSIDTVKPAVAEAALAAGARIVNDVSCGRSQALLEVVARAGAELVLMHNRGRGEVTEENASYGDPVRDVVEELLAAVARAEEAGVPRGRIWLDPGIGFAKRARDSAAVLAHTAEFVATGQRVLVGPSRKSFLAALAPGVDGRAPEPSDRLGGTAAAVVFAVLGGAHAVRVHDVAVMRQAVRVAEAMREVAS